VSSETDKQSFKRVDLEQLGESHGLGGTTRKPDKSISIRWIILPIAVLLCIAQAIIAVHAENINGIILTPTLISVLAFGVLLGIVLLVNPLARLLSGGLLKPLGRAEVMAVFASLLVTSGISTFGLSSQLIPMIPAPWNPNWNTPQRGWNEDLLPHMKRELYIAPPENASPEQVKQIEEQIMLFRRGIVVTDDQGRIIPRPTADDSWGDHISYWGQVYQRIPWGLWVKPLAYWMVFVGSCYAMFYFLTYIVLGFWNGREKLIFPLAKLPESLLPDDEKSWFPSIFKSLPFWLAFGLSMFVLSWNGAIAATWIPSAIGRIPLGMAHTSVAPMLKESIFEGLTGGAMDMKFLVIFTAIGIAFLLPLEISFSIWFYFIIGKLMILFAVWFGYGQTGADFPTDWLGANNFVTAQAGGGLLMFSGVSLARSLGDYIRRMRQQKDPGAMTRGIFVLAGLAVSLLTLAGWFWWVFHFEPIYLLWALALTSLLMLLTLGLMRIVAEGGVFWFQTHTGPMHVFKQFGLGNFINPVMVAPLLPAMYTLFMDYKTFLAPNLLNAGKMNEDTGRSRTRFHVIIVSSIVVSVVAALGFTIFLSYMQGGQQMHGWFHTAGPQSVLESARTLANAEPETHPGIITGYTGGAAWTAASIIVRRTVFWFPHPIGYIMLVNPLIASLWFSFFVGWIFKKIVVKYGGKTTYDKVMPAFIGLIVGELIAILVWFLLGQAFGFRSGLDLNRYGA